VKKIFEGCKRTIGNVYPMQSKSAWRNGSTGGIGLAEVTTEIIGTCMSVHVVIPPLRLSLITLFALATQWEVVPKGAIVDGMRVPEGTELHPPGGCGLTRKATEEIVLSLLDIIIPQGTGNKFISDAVNLIKASGDATSFDGLGTGSMDAALSYFASMYSMINGEGWAETGDRTCMDCGWRLMMIRGLIVLEDGSSVAGRDPDPRNPLVCIGPPKYKRGTVFPSEPRDVLVKLFMGRNAGGGSLFHSVRIGDLESLASYLTLRELGLVTVGVNESELSFTKWLPCGVGIYAANLTSSFKLRTWWYWLAAELLAYEKEATDGNRDDFAVVFDL